MFTESTRELELLFDNWRQNFRDKILSDDNKPTPAGEIHRVMLWELGSYRFHAVYTEISPGRSVYKLTVQPFNEKQNWSEVGNVDAFRSKLHEAKSTREHSAQERKAMKGMETNYSDHRPPGIIMEVLSGSHLYGLNHAGMEFEDGTKVKPSDEDIRGVFIIPTSDFIVNRFKPKNEVVNDFIQIRDCDTKYEEIDRFIYECLKANPERLELLNAENYIIDTQQWRELVKIRKAFYSKRRMYDALGGYATAQFMKWRKKEGDLWKPGMHLIRLMMMGINLFKTGEYNPDMSAHRDYLLSIRTGKVKAEQVADHFEKLKAEFEILYKGSSMQEQPDNDTICNYLRELRKNNW
jgi:predicted nucleotidyltransferase